MSWCLVRSEFMERSRFQIGVVIDLGFQFPRSLTTLKARSAGLNAINLSDEQLSQSNNWYAIQALSGGAAMLNPTGYAGVANQRTGEVAGLGEAFQQSKQSLLLGTFGRILGGVAGGVGTALGGKIFPKR
jgi:hypothetical protein